VQRAIHIGVAGWTIPSQHAALFPGERQHLARYARRFSAVEINSSFYRHHRPATYASWAATVPPDFRFAVKLPREITHRRKLVDAAEPLDRFLTETAALGDKRGPLLIQLPPSLAYSEGVALPFLEALRERSDAKLVCEPRHQSWFTDAVDAVLARLHIARAAADPAIVPRAAVPGGWTKLVYYRLHGAPKMYYSPYAPGQLDTIAVSLRATVKRRDETWCIFDNTARYAATIDALALIERL
jgi:uncharacterized protein YecE (DUF72 family)